MNPSRQHIDAAPASSRGGQQVACFFNKSTLHLALSEEIRVTQFPDDHRPSRGRGILGQAADRAGC